MDISTRMVKTTVGAIIEKDHKILLTKRKVEPFKGYWCLPGGHIEENETAVEAIRREVKEEVGLDFEPNFFGYFDEIIQEIKWHAIVLVFKGKFSGEVKINKEVSEYMWFSLEDAKNLKLAFKNKDIIENISEFSPLFKFFISLWGKRLPECFSRGSLRMCLFALNANTR